VKTVLPVVLGFSYFSLVVVDDDFVVDFIDVVVDIVILSKDTAGESLF